MQDGQDAALSDKTRGKNFAARSHRMQESDRGEKPGRDYANQATDPPRGCYRREKQKCLRDCQMSPRCYTSVRRIAAPQNDRWTPFRRQGNPAV